ncbi:hypothetical protein CEXT_726271 [Caerostris extrusa]|uniref:Uncharacterized protein n=1 Tax=Caerostris extrusa TaxID=172846 RepID=A0AAV4XA65_CAEEX|nr:hypothetical protein CEXT_726271 [Caerostris extrusa]
MSNFILVNKLAVPSSIEKSISSQRSFPLPTVPNSSLVGLISSSSFFVMIGCRPHRHQGNRSNNTTYLNKISDTANQSDELIDGL